MTYPSENLPSGQVLIRVRGEVDLANAHDFEAQILRHLHEGHDVICDFSDVSYFDLTGVRALERCNNAFRKENRTLVLAAVAQHIQHILRIVGFDEIPVATNTEHALDLLRGDQPC